MSPRRRGPIANPSSQSETKDTKNSKGKDGKKKIKHSLELAFIERQLSQLAAEFNVMENDLYDIDIKLSYTSEED